jgi:hypothetical protein
MGTWAELRERAKRVIARCTSLQHPGKIATVDPLP